MRLTVPFACLSSLILATLASATIPTKRGPTSPQHVNFWKLEARARASEASRSVKASPLVLQDSTTGFTLEPPDTPQHGPDYSKFPEQFFDQPVDHTDLSQGTFKQRYWINTRHYVPGSGGPVIVLDGGETSGGDRLPFLDTGIVEILTNATGGVGVVLEHRYYGTSIPVPDFSTDNLRWLNNEQATADSANFMSHVKFEGIDEDLTSPQTPWIYYGGSYAGARAAHMKILYPELVFGAIASSGRCLLHSAVHTLSVIPGVTHATLSNWEYYEVIRKAADPTCSAHIENAITTIDFLLQLPYLKGIVKALFGLQALEHDDDFASVLEGPLDAWQSKVWDPAVGSTRFDEFCETLGKPIGGATHVAALPIGHEDRLLTLWDDQKIDFSVLNYAEWIRENQVQPCLKYNMTVEECFGTYNDTKYTDTSISEDWRLWQFQVCTEWGYFSTAPPDPDYPRIVSKLLTMDYATKICRQAYPAGKYFTVPELPNITAVNVMGDFAIAADRLAIIDGEVDPWRPCTPHSEYANDREDTILQPFKLIPGAVHHYDEYGLRNVNDEPPEIQQIHREMIEQSELAKIQTNIVIQKLAEKFPSYAFETRFHETEGDKNQSKALFLLGGKALWTRGLEELLANKQVDMLVHSFKDVPTELPGEFKIGAILEREEYVDSLVVKAGSPYKMLEDLPAGSRIGTSSVRRAAQVKNYLRNHHKELDMVFKDVRGNLNTRLKKLDATGEDDAFDALILAKAGLWTCLAERAMLRTLEGGCSVPVGVNTKLTHVVEGDERLRSGELKLESGVLEITGCVTSLDGGRQFVKTIGERVTSTDEAEALGKRLGETLLDSGAREILEEIKVDRTTRAREAEESKTS
ncbi:putative extracellular serine carboxypeptidase S28 [Butyriboletus roseoflavus]|nr:putative extracellular serine carboxypeptidase S28 [Butyriboletus roseoflavus]